MNQFICLCNYEQSRASYLPTGKLVWQALHEFTPDKIQHSLLSFTAHQFKNDLEVNDPQVLSHFKVDAKDRDYQLRERNSLCIDLFNEAVFIQKLDYIY